MVSALIKIQFIFQIVREFSTDKSPFIWRYETNFPIKNSIKIYADLFLHKIGNVNL